MNELEAFKKAAWELLEKWENADLDEDFKLNTYYPFKEDFEEVCIKIKKWGE